MLLLEVDRRRLLGGAALVMAAPSLAFAQPAPIRDPRPIARAEHLARVAKAQGLMRRRALGALLIEPGASLTYFTGVRWNRSEHLTVAVIPATGDAFVVTPFFEEPSVRESLGLPAAIRTSTSRSPESRSTMT